MRNDNVKMDNTINIVFAADSNYAQHATVAMISIIRHTKSQERLRFLCWQIIYQRQQKKR